MKTTNDISNSRVRGFTLIEIVLVIVIVGILATVAMRAGRQMYDSARFEQTREELDRLAVAIVGNDRLHNNGVRTDFGYVGDVGALPTNLDALYTNPGYGTWRGPYIDNRFSQYGADFKTDAWGRSYNYAGVTITSTGSGTNLSRSLAPTADALLRNRVSGSVVDLDGTPPGAVYADSVRVLLTIPNGAGSTVIRNRYPDAGGYFQFDSIPIGNHTMRLVYEPTHDTIPFLVSVAPDSKPYARYALTDDLWYAAGQPPGLMGRYTLDEGSGQTAFDASGIAPDAVLQNDLLGAGWSAGRINGAFTFDGSDDYFETATSGTDLQITGDYSLSVWIYAEATQVTWAGIICRCTSNGSDNLWTLQWDNSSGSSTRMTLYHPSGANWRSTYTLADAADAWHHIVVTYRSSPARVRLYVDGALHSESTSLTTGPGSGLGKLRIGCDRTNYTWRGLIDDVRIYDRDLTADQVQALTGQGS